MVVFDEVYFGNFTNWYLQGSYFTDIHPPLAKLIMALVAWFAGYKGNIMFSAIGDDAKYPTMEYVLLRVTPAFFGALCVPLIYFSMRSMVCSQFASFIASILVMSDLMLIVEARHILSDGILHFFSCLRSSQSSWPSDPRAFSCLCWRAFVLASLPRANTRREGSFFWD
jgi:dolichyl-phosphate-mannose-protein mannosyltransferase